VIIRVRDTTTVRITAIPPQRNSEITDGFRVFWNERWTGKRVECNYCHHEFAEHATAQKNHLVSCEQLRLLHRARYERYRESARVSRSGASGGQVQGEGEHPKTMSPELKKEIDIFAATEVYVDARPFSSLSTPQMARFCNRLANLGGYSYTPPTPSELRTSLLTTVYNNVRNEVESCLRHEERVNVVFDESKDRAGHRISNTQLANNALQAQQAAANAGGQFRPFRPNPVTLGCVHKNPTYSPTPCRDAVLLRMGSYNSAQELWSKLSSAFGKVTTARRHNIKLQMYRRRSGLYPRGALSRP
jgi:hypothetical protein